MKDVGRKNITWEPRLLIQNLYEKNIKVAEIANQAGLCKRSVYRELARGSIDGIYNPNHAQEQSDIKKRNKGAPAFFKEHPHIAALIAKCINEDKLSIIETMHKLHEQNIVIPSRQTIYNAIIKGQIPNVNLDCLTKNITKVFSNGLVNLPIRIRQELNISDGDFLEFEVKNNKLIFKKINIEEYNG